MYAFNTLNNRYTITGTLQFETAVHLGSGLGDDRADDLFVRSNGAFYLPGSSIRGALRSTIERLATGLTAGTAAMSEITCFLDKNSGSKCLSPKQEAAKRFEAWRREDKTDSTILQELEENGHLCHVCRLFGSPFFASKIKIHDAFAAIDLPEKGTIRTGIGIDRDTEAVREGVLFEVEVLDNKPVFRFELMAENLEDETPFDWGLLALGLLEMVRGNFYLGAKSAAGLGKCSLLPISLEISGFSGKQELKKLLLDGKSPQGYRQDAAVTFLKNKLPAFFAALETVENE